MSAPEKESEITGVYNELGAAYGNVAYVRSGFYNLLSIAFRYPGPEILEVLRNKESRRLMEGAKEIFSGVPSLVGAIDAFARVAESVEDLHGLQVDYTRLFIGPFRLPAPPYESVYRRGSRGKLMGESTLEVRDMYLGEGLSLSDSIHDLPDHIIAELAFISYLSKQEALSWENGLGSEAYYIRRQDEFLTEHMMHWVPEFSRAILSNSAKEFYRLLATLTQRFVSLDRDFVKALGRSLRYGEDGNGRNSMRM